MKQMSKQSTMCLSSVYKVKLEVFEDGLSTDIYTMLVLEVIKEGTFDVGPLNKLAHSSVIRTAGSL
ncbi:hypothetical protein F7725_016144 [Dissostichus mawsoni]|uniref:Uncharacterized protein n=1 Tax=Dissostichus mawsoni TaxID=36200 RepID=A0A7J5Y3V2_DISMA|nr:hypothetical protein F7725_016144 [Dissostichus mawsoni]